MEENGEGEVRIKFGEERKVGSIWELRVGKDVNLSYPVGGGLDVVEYRIGRAPEKVELPDDGVERTVVNLKLVGEMGESLSKSEISRLAMVMRLGNKFVGLINPLSKWKIRWELGGRSKEEIYEGDSSESLDNTLGSMQQLRVDVGSKLSLIAGRVERKNATGGQSLRSLRLVRR